MDLGNSVNFSRSSTVGDATLMCTNRESLLSTFPSLGWFSGNVYLFFVFPVLVLVSLKCWTSNGFIWFYCLCRYFSWLDSGSFAWNHSWVCGFFRWEWEWYYLHLFILQYYLPTLGRITPNIVQLYVSVILLMEDCLRLDKMWN